MKFNQTVSKKLLSGVALAFSLFAIPTRRPPRR